MDNQQDNFLLYDTTNGEVRLQVYLQDETVWLTQKAMCLRELQTIGIG